MRGFELREGSVLGIDAPFFTGHTADPTLTLPRPSTPAATEEEEQKAALEGKMPPRATAQNPQD